MIAYTSIIYSIIIREEERIMIGALLEEVYGQDFAASPAAPKACDTVDTLPVLREEPKPTEDVQ